MHISSNTTIVKGKEIFYWQTFGHEGIKSILQKQLKARKFPHAYLFFGPEALGKYSLALEFAEKILDTSRPGIHPDFLELNAEGEILMETSLDFISKLKFKPFLAEKRVAIINNAQNLNAQSSNAFLKTLEEPSKSTIIILVSSRKLLPTITSRCQTLNFNAFSRNRMEKFASEKGLEVNTEILDISFGQPGRLIRLVNDPDFLKQEQDAIGRYKDLRNKKLSERFLSITKFAALEMMELEKIFSTWLYWQLKQLQKDPGEHKSVEAIAEAISGLKMNKNKKLVLQGLFLKI